MKCPGACAPSCSSRCQAVQEPPTRNRASPNGVPASSGRLDVADARSATTPKYSIGKSTSTGPEPTGRVSFSGRWLVTADAVGTAPTAVAPASTASATEARTSRRDVETMESSPSRTP